jgi:hypothetical protein
MGWIISQALYEKWHSSQGLVEESSEDTCLDGKQSAPLNGSHTQLVYLWPDKMTAFSRLSPSGMMCRPLTGNRGEDLLMWFREDFLAKTYPVQEREQALPDRAAVCGRTWHALSEKYDLDSCSWKIHHSLFPVELDWSSVILPRWGMTVSGQLYQHQTSERPISATGSGYWLTPTTMNIAPTEDRREKRTAYRASVGRKDSPGSLAEEVATPKFWPTPTCNMVSGGPNHNSPAVLAGQHGINLAGAVNRWPTPCATDYKGAGKNGELRDRLDYAVERGATKSNDYSMEVDLEAGGQLNPTWVEWLMGWPLGWTDLRPSAMDKFQSWQQQHLISCETDNA